MRHHFHRCGHLRVIEFDVRDLSHARKGDKQILDELRSFRSARLDAIDRAFDARSSGT